MTDQPRTSGGMWSVDHPVLQALRERRRAKSQPGQRIDDYKIGLAVEGGGMRGVVSGAMLAALEEFGFSSAFDALYGCSGGAINSAYFVAGDAWRALDLLPGSSQPEFPPAESISSRWLGARPCRGLRRNHGAGPAAALRKGARLANTAHRCTDNGRPYPATHRHRLHDPGRSQGGAHEQFLAARTGAGSGFYRGERAIDGSVLTSLPYRMAVDDNCTHVLSLSTFPAGSYQARPSTFTRLTARHVERLKKGLGAAYLEEAARKHTDLQRLARLRHDPGTERPYVLDLAPMPDQPTLARWEMRPRPLLAAITGAYELVYAAVEGQSSTAIGTGTFTALPRWTVVRP